MKTRVLLKSEERRTNLAKLITIYRHNKWIPCVIRLENIPDLEEAFERLPKKYRIDSNDKTPDFITKRNKALFLFSYLLALRPSEAVKLKFSDIQKDGYGRYYVLVRGENNKTGKDRTLPLPKRLVKVLNEWLSDFKYRKFWRNKDWLFPSTLRNGNHLSRYQWGDIFQRAINEAGLWRKHPRKDRGLYTAHSLRHTRAVELLEKSGFDIWSVSKILGHSTLEATMCYLHVCPSIQEHFRELIEK